MTTITIKQIVATAMLAFSVGVFAEVAKITQAEVDLAVTNEILRCIHDDDAEMAENVIRSKGATDSMLAQAYSRVMHKNKNAPVASEAAAYFQSATYGFSKTANENQLTNLLNVAETSTIGTHAVSAILAFHARKPASRFFVTWGTNMLHAASTSPKVKTAIWECFTKEMQMQAQPSDARRCIMDCARDSLDDDPSSAFYADRILEQNDPRYKQSESRRRMAAKMGAKTAAEGLNDVLRGYFQSISEMEKNK